MVVSKLKKVWKNLWIVRSFDARRIVINASCVIMAHLARMLGRANVYILAAMKFIWDRSFLWFLRSQKYIPLKGLFLLGTCTYFEKSAVSNSCTYSVPHLGGVNNRQGLCLCLLCSRKTKEPEPWAHEGALLPGWTEASEAKEDLAGSGESAQQLREGWLNGGQLSIRALSTASAHLL